MRRAWHLRRQTNPVRDGAQRWDRAYQAILQWAPAPVTAGVSVPVQEDKHAFRDLRPSVDDQSSPDPDHRATN